MGSSNGNRRARGSDWRGKVKDRQRRLAMESLENRRLLTTPTLPPLWQPGNTNLADAQHGPMADEGIDLVDLYQNFTKNTGFGPLTDKLNLKGNTVEIDARGYGSAASFIVGLQAQGMHVSTTKAEGSVTIVEGFIPIANLPNIAQMPQMVGVSASYKPSVSFIGAADNEAETAVGAATARNQFKVDGTGITVGVLSDSVNEFAGGIADSVKTGDIPSASRVDVLQDGTDPGPTDEGRAMIENIFDIAPGVNTAFATADGGDLNFAANIQNLATNAHAQVITDDVVYFDEPEFQDGPIAQAVHNVVNSGVVYTSAAQNAGNAGYMAPWRGVTASPLGSPSGLFQNFNTGAGAAISTIQITVTQESIFSLQWDNPFFTSNGVTANVVLDAWDSNGNQILSAANNNNAVATQTPQQLFDVQPGTYTIAIQTTTAATPGEIRFQQIGDGGINFTFPASTQGAGVSHPTSVGHSATFGMLGTGAVPWFGTGPYVSQDVAGAPPNTNEPYSSTGPTLLFFNPDGSRMAAPQTVLQPTVSAPDGGNTSFFAPGEIISTTNPPNPPQPVTKTNLSQNLPSFFGTSSAAPNLAAIAALMKQLDPFATPALITQGMIASATPLNGGQAGVWQPDGGYGEVNAVAALSFVNQLRVVSIIPGSGQTVGQAPQFIQVTFNQPVNLATILPNDLKVVAPNGVTVTIGAPIAVDKPTNPTVVDFPITITHSPGVVADGTYVEAVADYVSNVLSASGKQLVASAATSFIVADLTPPKITGTTYIGRTIKISFSEPIDPTTVTKGDFFLVRSGNASGTLGTASQIILSNDSRVALTYDPTTNTVTMDLSGLPQTLLPSDTYELLIASPTFNANGTLRTAGVTDIVGIPLDGEFNGVSFPTGNGVAGGNFGQLKVVTLAGPIFNFEQLAAASDSGIKGDQNTNVTRPTFTGQLGANFPGTVAGVIVLAEFNGLPHNNTLTGRPEAPGTVDLAVGPGGRGFVGNFDTFAVTNAAGQFTITAPANLPDGLNNVTFVAVAPPDQQVVPGLATATSLTFRIDTSLPKLDTSGAHPNGSSIPTGSNLNSLSTLTLFITDPVNPQTLGSPLAVPTLLSVPALDPSTANNISNYSLLLTDPNGKLVIAGTHYDDESSFITSATFTSTTKRVFTSDPYTGTIGLTFAPGLPSGAYTFVAHAPGGGFTGITDAAGNPLAGFAAAPGTPNDYHLQFNLQAGPAFITDLGAISGSTISNPRAYFEEPAAAGLPNADGTPTPPSEFIIDVSNPLRDLGAGGYNNFVQLIASADTVGGAPDGNFGTLGTSDSGQGYSIVPGTTVTLTSFPLPNGTMPVAGQPGFNQRLILSIPTGSILPPDYYRLYIPNDVNPTTGVDTRIFDKFGNQVDGEFLGDQTASGTFEDLLPTGQYRAGLSGDGVPGGSFATGYVVVPNGNVIFANPSYQYDPFNAAQLPNGSPLRPYPVLAPEAIPTAANGGNLNSPLNFGPAFNPIYDRSGDGKFEPSALFAAEVAAANGPVVVVAEAGNVITNPTTGAQSQAAFVLQAPSSGNSGVNDGSVAIPMMTTLVFQPGATLKLQNAALLVQNQGSALEALGGAGSGQQVTFTSYADDSVGGDTNHDAANTQPRAGDWGGIVFRNFDQQDRSSSFPGQIPITGVPAVDDRLKGPDGDAISGADDLMSTINLSVVKYGGGAVPQGVGTRYDAITMQASRPTITNTSIALSGGAGGADAGLSVDVDALREDNLARGPLLRRLTFSNNSLNGIFLQGEPNGIAEPTDAMTYPINPSNEGGAQNYTLDDPYPYLLTTPMVIGSVFEEETGGLQTSEPDRLYIQPGMMMKFEAGSGLEIKSQGISGRQASLNIGVRTYLNEFDNNPSLSPVLADGTPNPNFVANSTNNATVLLTSFFDDTASTSYTDPTTQVTTVIVAPLPATGNGLNDPFQPTKSNVPTQARWGGVQIDSPAVAVINNATFQYGGGTVNTPTGTTGRHALEFAGAQAIGGGIFGNPTGQGTGTHVSITDNNFFFDGNFDPSNPDDTANNTPIGITPDGLLAGNTATPLSSGAPFFHNNVLIGNGINGLGVSGDGNLRENGVDDVDSLWPGSDMTYIVRDTISMGPFAGFTPPPVTNTTVAGSELRATVTLTIESTLPGTILADGSVVAKPGISPIIKLGEDPAPAATTGNTTQPTIASEIQEGAGFVSGMDNGVDPTADPLIDIGVDSEMRFLGIGANQATGQIRVPVILTSIHDSTAGTTVRGVTMNVAITGDQQAPQAGDGGNIIFGSHTMTTYNLNDPRQGNLIDNVDATYLTRIEQIGGGIIQAYDVTGTGNFNAQNEPLTAEQTGQPIFTLDPLTGQLVRSFATENNLANSLTVSNSNISNFRDFGFWAHPGFTPLITAENYPSSPQTTRGGEPFVQQSTLSFLVNDTFSGITNNPAVEIDGNNVPFPTSAGQPIPVTTEAVLLNDTFYNNLIGLDLNHPTVPGTQTQTAIQSPIAYGQPSDLGNPNRTSDATVLAMNNIFDNNAFAGISLWHGVWGTQGQYNLFNANGTGTPPAGVAVSPAVANNGAAGFGGNNQAVFGDPDFIDAAAGNFNLGPNSAAINASRSELGPSIFGDMLFPAADQVLTAQGGVLNFTGHSNSFGDAGTAPVGQDFVFLPGSPLPNYVTSWVPVLPSSPFAIPGPSTDPGVWDYASLVAIAQGSQGTVVVPPGGGERDQNGIQRLDDPTVPITGTGSQPYFDIGAFEFIQFFPPDVTGVTASFNDPTTGLASNRNIYAVDSIAGTNVAPQSIQVRFNHQIDPTTISSATVMLEASTDGTFNSNSPTTTFINLAGKLVFDPTTDVLTISLGASGLILGNAEYRLILVGTGSQELRDPQGNALDGENLDAAGQQRALPSGDGNPGGNFQLTFTVDTHPPSLVAGTFNFAPQTYTNPDAVGTGITNQTLPTFEGTVTDIFPPANPVQGDTVFIDVSTAGNGVFNDLNAGVGTTDANGNFVVTLTTPLPQTNYNVGPDGLLGTADDTGYSEARVRVVDQSGNVSNTTTGTLQSFAAQGALFNFVIDTIPPRVTSITPGANALAPVVNGVIPFSVTFNKNIDPKTLTANSILVVRSGGDGIFGNGNDVKMAIDPASIKVVPLKNGPLGPETVTFNVISSTGATIANDEYQVTLKGTGANPITDIAGNPLAGATGTNPVDITTPVIVLTPSLAHNFFVGPAFDVTDPTQPAGTIENPFPTIAKGLAAANVGDVVAVLPGVYTESITLKSLVTLESASPFSSDTTVLPGDPLQTIIRAPQSANPTVTVTGTNLVSAAGGAASSKLTGFSIASPLQFDPSSGPINQFSIGLSLTNSSIVVSDDYFVDSGAGIFINNTVAGAPMPTLFNDVVAGNFQGILVTDTASSVANLGLIENSDILFNTFGLSINAGKVAPILVGVNDIFWQNHDPAQTSGFAIGATNTNLIYVYDNMFADNGPNLTSPADDTFNVSSAGGFNPANLTTTGPDFWGNFVGEPAFVAPRDPRPGSDGPAVFFNDGNFDLTAKSAAIDRADPFNVPATDILGRGRTAVPGHAFFVAGLNSATGPADVGAFEFNGTGGNGTGVSTFHVTTTTLFSGAVFNGTPQTVSQFSAGAVPVTTKATAMIVKFSAPVNQSTLAATDLLISGSGDVNLKATALTWIDSETVEFTLTGGYNTSGGVVQIGLKKGKLKTTTGTVLTGFNETVSLTTTSPPSPPVPPVPPVVPSPPVPPPPPVTSPPVGSPVLPPPPPFTPPPPTHS